MNINRVFVRVAILCLPLILITLSCKKKRAFNEENGQSAEDVRSFQSQSDEAVRDVNIAIMEESLLRGREASPAGVTTTSTELCGSIIDTLNLLFGGTRLTYNGVSCNGVKKTGDIIITLTNYPITKWKNPGCIVKIDFIAYKTTRSNGKTIQLDGVMYLKNESGGTWYEMRYLNAGSLVQTQTAENLRITLDGSNTAIFNVNRKLTFNYINQITTCKIEGLGSSNGLSSLENWGQDRNGNNFTTQISTPVLWKSRCGVTLPVEGEISLSVEKKDFDMNFKFGVDQQGNGVSDDNICPYGWKVSWSYKKKTNTRIFAYN